MSKRENSYSFPKISIVIPSLNKVKYIGETLESITSQNYPNLEVIIQDGGSVDGTLEIIKKYSAKYPKIIKWESKKDKGQLSAITIGMKKAKGEILAYINADDIYKNGTFMKVANQYLKERGCLWFAGYGDMIDSKGKKIAILTAVYKRILTIINYYPLLLLVNYIMQPSVFLTKRAYVRYGPFTGTGNFILEYDMWLKLGREEMPNLVPFGLASFRMSEGNISSRQYSVVLEEDMEVVQKYTNNRLILVLHKLHNYLRTVLVKTL
jgi:glycosyltransferase involved in cell wall biosynthesis